MKAVLWQVLQIQPEITEKEADACACAPPRANTEKELSDEINMNNKRKLDCLDS